LSKIGLDEGVPEQIAPRLSGHDVQSVRELELKGTNNTKLLDAIEALGFDAFVSKTTRLGQIWPYKLQQRPLSVKLTYRDSTWVMVTPS